MIRFESKFFLDAKGVLDAVSQAAVKPLDEAAALVEIEAKFSMKTGGGKIRKASLVGEPPNVQTGILRGSIRWARDRTRRVIGPTVQAFYGRLHEFGLGRFPFRPFMRPALFKTRQRFAGLFRKLRLAVTKAGRRLNSRGFKL